MTESEQMVEVVRTNGTPVWWLLGKDEGHGFEKKKNHDFQFYSTLVFVKKFLLSSATVAMPVVRVGEARLGPARASTCFLNRRRSAFRESDRSR